MNLETMAWTRKPASFVMRPDRIEITTAPYTDLWQRTYYHFRNDNAPVLQLETDEKYFSFIVKTDFRESHHRFHRSPRSPGTMRPLQRQTAWQRPKSEFKDIGVFLCDTSVILPVLYCSRKKEIGRPTGKGIRGGKTT